MYSALESLEKVYPTDAEKIILQRKKLLWPYISKLHQEVGQCFPIPIWRWTLLTQELVRTFHCWHQIILLPTSNGWNAFLRLTDIRIKGWMWKCIGFLWKGISSQPSLEMKTQNPSCFARFDSSFRYHGKVNIYIWQ